MITPKYDNIPYGQFQGYVDHLSQEIADGQDKFLSAIGKRKSRIELCDIISYTFDDEVGEVEVFYRVIDMPKSQQTDVCEDNYTIECVKKDGVEITIRGRDEQNILEHLNRNYPIHLNQRA